MQMGRIALWQAAEQYDAARGEFEMFAYTRIKYAMYRALTNANKIEQFEGALEDTKLQFVLEHHIDSTEQFDMPVWMGELSDEEKKLIHAIYEQQLTTKEIAERYDYSYEALKKKRQRLMKKLKQLANER